MWYFTSDQPGGFKAKSPQTFFEIWPAHPAGLEDFKAKSPKTFLEIWPADPAKFQRTFGQTFLEIPLAGPKISKQSLRKRSLKSPQV